MRGVLDRSHGVRYVLSRSEKRLLKALVESKGGESISSLCERAGVSTKVWYRMLEQAIDYLLSQQLVPVIQTIVRKALEGSAKHSELILKISGLLPGDSPQILQVFGKGEGEDRQTIEARIQKFLLGGVERE